MTRYVPLVVTTGLFLVSWALLAVGPIDWHLVRPLRVHLFLAAATAAFAGGYLFAVRRGRSAVKSVPADPDASTLVVSAAVVYLLLYLPVMWTTTGSWLPDVWGGLSDAGSAYARNKRLNESATPVFLYVRMLVAPLTILIFPLTLFLWPRLSRPARVAGKSCVLLSVALTVAQGINRGVAEFCGQLVLFLVLVAASSLSQDRRGRLLRSMLGIVLVIGVFFAYYATTMNSRISADAEERRRLIAERRRPHARHGAQRCCHHARANPFFDVVPESLQSEGLISSSYLTHGYRGLSLAMDEDFHPDVGSRLLGVLPPQPAARGRPGATARRPSRRGHTPAS